MSYPKIGGYNDTTYEEIEKLENNIELFDNKLFLIKKIYKNIPCGGYGYLISKEDFLKIFKKENKDGGNRNS